MSATRHPLFVQVSGALALVQAEGNLTDGQLLERFLARRDELAFAALVRRHGPMVLSVCRRVLRNDSDAEDAFQAVFLVLVRKAATLSSRPILGDWLHGVAHRTALKARSAAFHRREKERETARAEAAPVEESNDWLPLLDQELTRLPEKYRLPIVLCDLEGRTRQEAAHQLGWPEGTVAGRLGRGRAMLAKRLLRRASAWAGLAGVLTAGTANGALPIRLAASALQAALHQRTLPAQTLHLAQGVLQSMSWNKLKAGVVALLVALAAAGGGLAYRVLPSAEQPNQTVRPPASTPEKLQPNSDKELLQGTWFVAAGEIAGQKMDDLKDRPRTVVFQGERVRVVEAARSDPPPFQLGYGTFQLGAGNKSKMIDITYGSLEDRFPGSSSSGSGTVQPIGFSTGVILGIYELNGGTLQLCLGGFNAQRPGGFTTRDEKGALLLTLVRKLEAPPAVPKTPEQKPDPKPDLKNPPEGAPTPPINLVKAALARDGFPAEGYPLLPSLSTELRGQVCGEIAGSMAVRAAYAKLDVAKRRNVDWFEGVAGLEKEKAVWSLLSCLCHPSEDVQIHALRSLERIKDKRAVPFLLLYAEYMAVWESGSENATIHGIIQQSAAKTLSTLTGVEQVLKGQDPEGLKKGIRKWRKWQVLQDE